MTQAEPRPAMSFPSPSALLRRVRAGGAVVPWRDRAFWVTQLLVAGAVGVHFVDDIYGGDVFHLPAVATLVLLAVPVGYAALRFGLGGSLPTAAWTVALMLPDILFLDTGLERWTDGSMLALVVIVALAAGRAVGTQRASFASRVAAKRLAGIARVADQLPEGICVVDLGGVITYANPAWASMQGLASGAAAVGHTLASFHGGEDVDADPLPYRLALGGPPVRRVVHHRRPGMPEYWADITVVALVDERGDAVGTLSTVRDVTVEKTAVAALQEAEERFRLTFEQAPLGMALITPEGGFLQVNDALCQGLGRSAREVFEVGMWGLTDPADHETLRKVFRYPSGRKRLVLRCLHGDGHLISLEISTSLVQDPAGRPLYFVAQFKDITQEQHSRQRLTKQAFHDSLTGLPNRVLFEDRVDQALARTRRQQSMLAIMFCDLDDFKEVNDRLGHQAGDQLLRSVATRLQGCVRDADTVARFGGDEFVVLLDGLSGAAEAEVTAARIHDALRRGHSVGDQEVTVSASIGIAIPDMETSGLEALLGEADTAMYRAKAAGGGCSRVFDDSLIHVARP